MVADTVATANHVNAPLRPRRTAQRRKITVLTQAAPLTSASRSSSILPSSIARNPNNNFPADQQNRTVRKAPQRMQNTEASTIETRPAAAGRRDVRRRLALPKPGPPPQLRVWDRHE